MTAHFFRWSTLFAIIIINIATCSPFFSPSQHEPECQPNTGGPLKANFLRLCGFRSPPHTHSILARIEWENLGRKFIFWERPTCCCKIYHWLVKLGKALLKPKPVMQSSFCKLIIYLYCVHLLSRLWGYHGSITSLQVVWSRDWLSKTVLYACSSSGCWFNSLGLKALAFCLNLYYLYSFQMRLQHRRHTPSFLFPTTCEIKHG